MTVKFLKWLPEDATLDQVLREVARVLRPGGVGLLHQQIQVAPQVNLKKGLRSAIAAIVKRKLLGRKAKAIKTRAVDEGRFLSMCRQVGLSPTFVITTLPIAVAATRKRVNAFYVVKKQG